MKETTTASWLGRRYEVVEVDGERAKIRALTPGVLGDRPEFKVFITELDAS